MTRLQERLFRLRDAEYAAFQAKLTPGIPADCFIGVRVPVLRAFAKEFVKEPEADSFLHALPHKYYDENMLHGLLISEVRDYNHCIELTDEFLPYVDNWNFRGALLGDKAVSVVFDDSRLKSAVPGFKATVNFDEGVRRTIEYILSHPECQVEDAEFDEWCDKVIASLEDAKKHILK